MSSNNGYENAGALHTLAQYQAIVRDTDDKKPRAHPNGYANGLLCDGLAA
nr:hypothetical protein [Janthinobacterium sp. Marseille]